MTTRVKIAVKRRVRTAAVYIFLILALGAVVFFIFRQMRADAAALARQQREKNASAVVTAAEHTVADPSSGSFGGFADTVLDR